MPKLSSLQDLTRVREEARQEVRNRADTGLVIRVGMGTCGIAAGARETLEAIQVQLAQRHMEAQVSTVGCLGMCAKEPLIDIQQAGKSRILYGNITADMVAKLFDEHICRGQPVRDWVICRL